MYSPRSLVTPDASTRLRDVMKRRFSFRSGPNDLSQNVVLHLLSNPRRRFILYYLRKASGPVELVTLAEEIAAWENDVAVEDLTSQQRKRVYVSLYQTHVPKLEEHGIVDYDADAGVVRFTGKAGEIGHYLSTDENERRWVRYYLALAVGTTLVLAAVVLGVPVVAALGELVTAGLTVVAFLILAIAHRLSLRRAEERALLDLVERER